MLNFYDIWGALSLELLDLNALVLITVTFSTATDFSFTAAAVFPCADLSSDSHAFWEVALTFIFLWNQLSVQIFFEIHFLLIIIVPRRQINQSSPRESS